MKKGALSFPDKLRCAVAGDVWSELPEAAEAVAWAQRLILDAADLLDRPARQPRSERQPRPPRPARREWSPAEKAAYGELMRAKRERETSRGSAPEGRKTKRQHLYSGHPEKTL